MKSPDDLEQPIRHTFQNLSKVPGLVHGVFTRHGGVSRQPYATLNAAWNNGDAPEAVRENLLRVKSAMGVEHLAASYQTHGDTIHVVDEDCLARAKVRHPVLLTPPGDALITRLRGVGLLIKIADCQAIFLVDPVKEVIANVHCGWRGSARASRNRLSPFFVTTLAASRKIFLPAFRLRLVLAVPSSGTMPRNCRLPSGRFRRSPDTSISGPLPAGSLSKAGLRSDHIEVANRCTVCESRDFFSYRGEKTTGRNAAVLAWRKNAEE